MFFIQVYYKLQAYVRFAVFLSSGDWLALYQDFIVLKHIFRLLATAVSNLATIE
jgi:acyl carrier protein phosphodiesterase